MSYTESALIELQYLPPVQFFSKCLHYPLLWIETEEHYTKRSYRNRCHLAGPNGILRLSVPLRSGKNEGMPIRKVQIAYDELWQAQHWSSIQTCYGNAPFFTFYAPELQDLYERQFEYLFDFNWTLLHRLFDLLRIKVHLEWTTVYESTPSEGVDLRNQILPTDQEGARDEHFQSVSYPQVFQERHGFLANLSILDLLFCTGPEAPQWLQRSWID